MNTPHVIADWHLQSSVWYIEDRPLKVEAVSALHPTIQGGLEADCYSIVIAPELYGMIRHWRPTTMIASYTDPIYIVLDYGSEEVPDFYFMTWDEYTKLKEYFVGHVEEKSNWSVDGF